MEFDSLLFTFFCSRFDQFDCTRIHFVRSENFNVISCCLFNCFARVFLNTLVNLISILRIYLTIFTNSVLLSLRNDTSPIDVNVCNVFKLSSTLFHIQCTSYPIFLKNIKIFLHALVYGTYLLYLIFLYFHNIFHLTDDCIMRCARSFICWIK